MATKSKHRKNHKQKVEARRTKMQNEKRATEKRQREAIMELIRQEQANGHFDDAQVVPNPNVADTPIEGPSI